MDVNAMLVPLEPTQAMIDAGNAAEPRVELIYKAMLAAALLAPVTAAAPVPVTLKYVQDAPTHDPAVDVDDAQRGS